MRSKSKATTASIILLVVFALALVGGESVQPPMPICSDGIDNDNDGFADDLDLNCRYITPSFDVYCPNWNNETTSPNSFSECDGN
jgi:hypothetical protein